MSGSAVAIREMIDAELAGVSDPRVADFVREMLVEPTLELRDWEYGDPDERFPCWIVLRNGDVGIAWCEHGFGPRYPWGLVFVQGDMRHAIGSDAAWYATFLQALKDEALSSLPVWRVFETMPDGAARPITGEASWGATWTEVERFRALNPGVRYECDTLVL